MKIESPRFGTLEVEPSRIIEFPRGLIGFEECKRFSLFHPEGETPSYFILQSLDDPVLAFHIADPAPFGFGHEIILSDAEAADLGLGDNGGCRVADAAAPAVRTYSPPGPGCGPLARQAMLPARRPLDRRLDTAARRLPRFTPAAPSGVHPKRLGCL